VPPSVRRYAAPQGQGAAVERFFGREADGGGRDGLLHSPAQARAWRLRLTRFGTRLAPHNEVGIGRQSRGCAMSYRMGVRPGKAISALGMVGGGLFVLLG